MEEGNLFIYILRLKNNKYYVGKTVNLLTRLEAHKNGTACSWTKKHELIFIERVIERASTYDEDRYTKEYMNKYGIDNVRGGTYVMEHLPEDQINFLLRELAMANNNCLKCGSNGHFIANCKSNIKINTTNTNTNTNNTNINNTNTNINNININNTIPTKPINNTITTKPINNTINTTPTKPINNTIPTKPINNTITTVTTVPTKPIKNKTTKSGSKKSDIANKGKKWSLNEDNDLCKFYDSGMSITDIAKIHQRTEYAIKVRLKKFNKID